MIRSVSILSAWSHPADQSRGNLSRKRFWDPSSYSFLASGQQKLRISISAHLAEK